MCNFRCILCQCQCQRIVAKIPCPWVSWRDKQACLRLFAYLTSSTPAFRVIILAILSCCKCGQHNQIKSQQNNMMQLQSKVTSLNFIEPRLIGVVFPKRFFSFIRCCKSYPVMQSSILSSPKSKLFGFVFNAHRFIVSWSLQQYKGIPITQASLPLRCVSLGPFAKEILFIFQML